MTFKTCSICVLKQANLKGGTRKVGKHKKNRRKKEGERAREKSIK